MSQVMLTVASSQNGSMNAVDASVSPEVEQHYLALQFLQRERLAGVEPLQAGGELGSRGRAGEGSGGFGGVRSRR